ncbi:MAG: hypothetical protein HKP25_08290 [Marinicaulis sp.]|nr:hypothetical protein [Marinicaulis sp.]
MARWSGKIRLALRVLLAPIVLGASAQAQTTICQNRLITTFDFRNPVLESGTALSVGAVYRFSNVATGADALVSIDALNSGTLNIIDRDTGLLENFQPELNNIGAASADFTITFVIAGTSTPASFDFAASGIDIDGNNNNLREYAEFSIPFQEYVLDSPTELDVNASGPSAANRIRFESRTPMVAPGIDPTATGNIVSTFYAGVSSFEYRIGTLGTGNMTRLNSLDFNCPTLNFPTPAPQDDQDFSDAPVAPYGDPRHDIVAGIQIGASNTVETTAYNHPSANADTGDDGVTIPALEPSSISFIQVDVSGAGGLLQAWIDWDDNGDFTTSGDQIAADVSDGGAGDNDGMVNGQIQLAVTPPAMASIGNTFARFRWSTQAGVNSAITAPDGEVEDYQVSISATSPPFCPPGEIIISNTGNADAVVVTAINSNAALGGLAPAGAPTSNANSARINNGNPTLVLDLTDTVPENSVIEISLAKNNNAGAADISFSPDNSTWYFVTNFSSGALDTLQRISHPATTDGVRYVRFQRTSGSTHIDGVEYTQSCVSTATLASTKTVAAQDPVNAPFAIPGSDVIYTIRTSNTGGANVDADTVFLVDFLPSEVEFYNGDFDDGGAGTTVVEFTENASGLTYTEANDLGFSNAGSAPANFAACSYSPTPGYDSNVTYVCFNPKGAFADGDPDPWFQFRFRARIK